LCRKVTRAPAMVPPIARMAILGSGGRPSAAHPTDGERAIRAKVKRHWMTRD